MLDIAATRAVDQAAQGLTELAQKIWETPETAYNEVDRKSTRLNSSHMHDTH